MIVQCDKCRTKFRIADERVTAKGVKVRCSRCAHVFVVHKEDDAHFTAQGPETTRLKPSELLDLAAQTHPEAPDPTGPDAVTSIMSPRSSTEVDGSSRGFPPPATTEQAARALGFAGQSAGAADGPDAITVQAPVASTAIPPSDSALQALPSFPSWSTNETRAGNLEDGELGLPPDQLAESPTIAQAGLPAEANRPTADYKLPPGMDPVAAYDPDHAAAELSPDEDVAAQSSPRLSAPPPLPPDSQPPTSDPQAPPVDAPFGTFGSPAPFGATADASGSGSGLPQSNPFAGSLGSSPFAPELSGVRSNPFSTPHTGSNSVLNAQYDDGPSSNPGASSVGSSPGLAPVGAPHAPSSSPFAAPLDGTGGSADIPGLLPPDAFNDSDPFGGDDDESSASGMSAFDEKTPMPPQAEPDPGNIALARINLGKAGVSNVSDRWAQSETTAIAAQYDKDAAPAAQLRHELPQVGDRGGLWPSMIGAVIGLAVVVAFFPEVGGGLLDWVSPRGGDAITLVRARPGVLPEGLTNLRALRTRVTAYRIGSGEEVLVVRGTARNLGKTPVRGLSAVALAMDGDAVVARASAPVGVMLTPDVLAGLGAPQEVATAYALRSAGAELYEVAPGGESPFMVVFPEMPREPRDRTFLVEFVPLAL